MKNHHFFEKITYKRIAFVMMVLFAISLLPILYCSFFDYATGDDLWEGAAAYRVLANQGTVKEFFYSVYEWAKMDYFGWEGNWSSIILWCLEPSIWGEKVYCVTPWIALVSICGGVGYFLNHYLKKYLACDRAFWAIVSMLVCFFSIQYMPYVKSGIFWYTGMINYIFPYGLCLVSFVWMDKFVETGQKRYCVFTALFFTYLGGVGYIPIVLAFEIAVLIILSNLLSCRKERMHRALWLLIPVAFLIIGFIFSAISPGNAARGGDTYYFGAARALLTILESVKQGFWGGINWFISVRPLFLTAPFLFIAAWEKIDPAEVKLKLKYPLVAIALLFLISCSVYAPGIYAQSEVSGGVPDSIYFVFLMAYVLGIIYLTCYIKRLYINKGWNMGKVGFMEKLRGLTILGTILFCMVFGRFLIDNMTDYICMRFISSGQLRDFEYQMQERLKILNDPEIVNAVVPEMNDEQGPFMHMALLSDPDAYTNKATARFYGKETVIAIPRSEYYELYGYSEDEGKQ